MQFNWLVHIFSDQSKFKIISLLFYCLKYLNTDFRYSIVLYISTVMDIRQSTKHTPVCIYLWEIYYAINITNLFNVLLEV